jgi:hypothetical protein
MVVGHDRVVSSWFVSLGRYRFGEVSLQSPRAHARLVTLVGRLG